MNFSEFYDFCISLDQVEESFPFDNNTLVFKKKNKIFALSNTLDFDFINMKCDPLKAVELREQYPGIRPGYHMNKKHWNSVYVNQDVSDSLVYDLILRSYFLI
ncbi:MmcQ/YjbR family DNA-binding protein [Crocinitomicaceae bacterium]|nr:MmcQ/YjbR family DNA-binding protein [Crocinitomicaceae bacterium]